MDELFGLSMNVIMVVLLVIFLMAMAVVIVLALLNRIMLKMGLRNIPRRKTQTVLIIIGIMLSTVIMAAAFGVGDTINFSIRNEAVEALDTIDEIIVSNRADEDDSFGTSSYIPFERFQQLEVELAGLDTIDGLSAGIGETVPTINTRTSLSEGRMRVAGVNPASLEGFGTFRLTSGEKADLEALAEDQAYINDEAAEELEAVAGDVLRLTVEGEALSFRVLGVVDRGGLAGRTSTLIIHLERAQSIFGRVGEINFIAVSNRGDKISGADLSDEVTEDLRVLFADSEVAAQLKELLRQEAVLVALEHHQEGLSGSLQTDVSQLITELRREEVSDQLISLLADDEVSSEILDALDEPGLIEEQGKVDTLFRELGEFRVFDIKQRLLDAAAEVSSVVTTFFLILGLFSIMVGVLLIFLIFVMLAAARRSEMGMARAIGAKRRHLVQMFVFEGTAYALVSAAVGVLLGLAVSVLITVVVNRAISNVDEDFRFTSHFELRSAIVAYCLGMVITFATVAFSAYRVSRMNIVAAVRGTPEALVAKGELPISQRLVLVGQALVRPVFFAVRGVIALAKIRIGGFLLNTTLAVLWVILFPIWIIDAVISLFRFAWPYLRRGWLTFILGLLIIWIGITGEQVAPFTIGASLMIIGLGLMLRLLVMRKALPAEVFGGLILLGGIPLLAHGVVEVKWIATISGITLLVIGTAMVAPFLLGRWERRQETTDRGAYTFIGVLMLAFWVQPFGTLDPLTGELESDIEMFFVSGVAVVAAAVWVVMYNADLLLRGLTFITGGIGQVRPVMVTAVAYPMSAKFRTGLTLAMFGLVIFSLIVMSILTRVFDVSTVDQDIVTGGWDIEGDVNFNTPIADVRQAIDDHPDLRLRDFEAIGGFTAFGVQIRQIGAEEQLWQWYAVRAADDAFLEATQHRLKLVANGFGPAESDVWDALRQDPLLAVVDAAVVPTRSGFADDDIPFELEGLLYEDESMDPIEIEVREPRTGVVIQLTVIGVLDRLSDGFGELAFGMFVSNRKLDEAIPFPIPITTYRFRVAQGVFVDPLAKDLEAAFQEHGMETEVMAELIEDQAAFQRAFNLMFTGFMGLGLMVGIASLGVVATRAVVERRQQIGVLRAIGYRRRMVQLSFLLESSFIALLGIAIGVGLGTIISYNIFEDVKEDVETLRFSFPWLQILAIVAVAYLFSMVTTFLPARQASRIYPAEALRYE